ncbi:MAG: hypothetical protein ABS43_24460 [Bordetella sp. SCN 67-23]|nr:hypothetical protein [Burkholderiales bacterium]ODS69937.1 MAG: hypothetical protein ABS43_24460 [Bordetella sp. SCN 67-23]OJW93429.1 MAG: hypothetical protein BGO71_15735 [Burkholderiales bacterium 67-32]
MASTLSLTGAVHTAVSLIPVVAGFYGFARYRVIEPAMRSGRVYLAGLTVSVFTSFGLSSTGGFSPAHALGILALLAAFGSLLVPRLSFLGRLRPYLAAFGCSFSFFLLLIPAIAETLTRLPTMRPLADSPQSPLVRFTLLAWVVTFIAGFVFQVWMIRSRRRNAVRGGSPAR